MSAPEVSVVLCVHRDRGGLSASITSVLGQEGVGLELILVDDSGSGAIQAATDTSDRRVRWVVNEANLGLTRALNRGLDAATAPLIARIDEGDLWAAGKLAVQLRRLTDEPSLVAIGCRFREALPGGGCADGPQLPLADCELRRALAAGRNPFAHPAMVFRNLGLRYHPTFRVAQDFELWSRLAVLGRLANLPDRLMTYDRRAASVSDANVLDQWANPLVASRLWHGYRQRLDRAALVQLARSGLPEDAIEQALRTLLTPAMRRAVPSFVRSSQAGGLRRLLGTAVAVSCCPRLLLIGRDRRRQAAGVGEDG